MAADLATVEVLPAKKRAGACFAAGVASSGAEAVIEDGHDATYHLMPFGFV